MSSLLRGLKCATLLLLLASSASCDAANTGRLAIRPEHAFSDPKQATLAAAAEAGDVGDIERAVKSGADVKAVGQRRTTALWYAFANRQKNAFARLLELGADPNTPSETGEPLIGRCVMTPDSDYLKLALAHGGNPNAANLENGLPAMFRAVSAESTEKLALLLRAGADVNIRGRDGTTPLVFASSARKLDKVLFLLRHGADPFLRNEVGNDIAAGLFGPNWPKEDKERAQVLKQLESRGIKFDWAMIEQAEIGNLGEATGNEPPKWLKSNMSEPNPAWVKANPEKAEQWYQAVKKRPAPKY